MRIGFMFSNGICTIFQPRTTWIIFKNKHNNNANPICIVGYKDRLTTLNSIKNHIINKSILTIASFKGFLQNFRCPCSVHLTWSIKLSFLIPLMAFMGCLLVQPNHFQASLCIPLNWCYSDFIPNAFIPKMIFSIMFLIHLYFCMSLHNF